MDNIGMASMGVVDTLAVSQATQSNTHASPLPPALAAKREADGLPVYFDREVDLKLPRRLFAGWIPSSGPREIVRALTKEEAATVAARAVALQAALRPFSGEVEAAEVCSSLGALLGGNRSMRQQGIDVESTVEITMGVLRDYPAWAITRACFQIAKKGIERDGVFERRYAPNDTEISGAVEGVVRGYRKRMKQAFALLAAPVEKPPPARPKAPPLAPRLPGDGKHAERIAADLAARKERKAAETSDVS